MEQIFLLFQCSLLSWKGCLSFINCTVSQSVSVYSPGLVTSSQFPPASALTSAEAVLAWAGLNTQGRERGEEGGRREAILIIMSTWNLQEQQSEETLWAALSAISRQITACLLSFIQKISDLFSTTLISCADMLSGQFKQIFLNILVSIMKTLVCLLFLENIKL